MARFQDVCKVTEVPDGQSRMFVVAEHRIGIFRLDGAILRA